MLVYFTTSYRRFPHFLKASHFRPQHINKNCSRK
jgi:hypothetical protein